MSPFRVAALALSLLGTSCSSEEDGCKNDNECKGDRICKDGTCADPTSGSGGVGAGGSGTGGSGAVGGTGTGGFSTGGAAGAAGCPAKCKTECWHLLLGSGRVRSHSALQRQSVLHIVAARARAQAHLHDNARE